MLFSLSIIIKRLYFWKGNFLAGLIRKHDLNSSIHFHHFFVTLLVCSIISYEDERIWHTFSCTTSSSPTNSTAGCQSQQDYFTDYQGVGGSLTMQNPPFFYSRSVFFVIIIKLVFFNELLQVMHKLYDVFNNLETANSSQTRAPKCLGIFAGLCCHLQEEPKNSFQNL